LPGLVDPDEPETAALHPRREVPDLVHQQLPHGLVLLVVHHDEEAEQDEAGQRERARAEEGLPKGRLERRVCRTRVADDDVPRGEAAAAGEQPLRAEVLQNAAVGEVNPLVPGERSTERWELASL